MARPSNTELDDVAAHLLLFKASPPVLPLPAHDPATDARFATLTADPRFDDLAFAVIRYDLNGPTRTFLHNPDVSWDIGSAGKLSVAIGALSLLKDIRSMTLAGVIGSTIAGSKLDDLLRHVWSRHADAKIRKLGTDGHFPQPSRMFDIPANPVRFRGIDTMDFTALAARSHDGHISAAALGNTTFADRLHLTIGLSDNRAARACQGELGIGFINAVIAKLGLFDEAAGTGIRVSGSYSVRTAKSRELPTNWRQPVHIGRAQARITPTMRPDGRPYVASVRALAALMMAIMEDGFLDLDISEQFRSLLLLRPGFGIVSFALTGVESELGAPPPPNEQFSKIGILWSNAEFVHINVSGVRYSLIILGLVDKNGESWATRAEELGRQVHRRIMQP